MPINAHFAVTGRDGVARESALVTEVFNYLDHLYYTGVFTAKQAEGFAKRLTKVKTVAGLTKLAKDVKAMEDAVLHRNPRHAPTRRRAPARRRAPTRRRNPSALQDQVEKQVKARMQELIDEDDEGRGQRYAGYVKSMWEGRYYHDLYTKGVITKEQEKALIAERRASFDPESLLYDYRGY